MNNLGRLIEKRLKVEAATALRKEAEARALELRAEAAVIEAALIGPVPLWTRHLAIEKRRRELVAGGDILWKPVDSTARRVIQKAPWWSFPLKTTDVSKLPAKVEKPITKRHLLKQIEKRMSQSPTVTRHRNPAETDGSQREATKHPDVFNAELTSGFVKKAEASQDEARALVDKCMDARDAMEILCGTFKASWFEFMEEGNTRLKDYRMFRMAMDTETRQLMASVREVRQFFLDANYETERARLKEFVEICERLKALKDSGFLDDVADTMLKMSVKP